MSYSIYVVTREEGLARRMHKYLRSAINEKWLSNARIATNFEPLSSSLSYADLGKDRYQVGFNYSCMNSVERAFVWDVIRWMAKVMSLTTYVYDGCERIKIGGIKARSSLDQAYEMPHVSRVSAILIRCLVGPSKADITKAKHRLCQIADGWT